MSDAQTTVLYTLSTLAQTCAALAAFVGAVGLYHLQSRRGRQRDLLREISTGVGNPAATPEAILTEAEVNRERYSTHLPPIIQEYRTIPRLVRASRRGLVVFEGWNLLVIFVTLVGFNYVQALASCSWTFWANWVAAVGTVLVTVHCVVAWTKG